MAASAANDMQNITYKECHKSNYICYLYANKSSIGDTSQSLLILTHELSWYGKNTYFQNSKWPPAAIIR